jgi:hypothetical protein
LAFRSRCARAATCRGPGDKERLVFTLISIDRERSIVDVLQHPIGPHRLSADAEGLTLTTEETIARTRRSGVDRIEEAPDPAFIYVGALNAHVLPETGRRRGQSARFHRYDPAFPRQRGPAPFDTGITPMPPSNRAMKSVVCALT